MDGNLKYVRLSRLSLTHGKGVCYINSMKEIKFSQALDDKCAEVVSNLGPDADAIMDLADQFISNDSNEHTNHECVSVGYNLAELAGDKDVYAVEVASLKHTLYFIGTEKEIIKKLELED